MPDVSSTLNEDQILRLKSRLSQSVNTNQTATVEVKNPFVIYPVISLGETSVVTGGMQKMTVTTLEVALFAKDYQTNTSFSSVQLKLQGSGNNQVQAISNAISKLNASDVTVGRFINEAREKIVKYYNETCEGLIQKATTLASANDYEQSIAILNAVPLESSKCYPTAQKLSLGFYKKYQTQLCAKNISIAKALIATKEFNDAIRVLELIDPQANCSKEVNLLIAEISAKVEKRDLLALDVEKRRISAMQEIAKAYYSQSIIKVNYNFLVK